MFRFVFFAPTLLAVLAVFVLVISLRYIPAAHTAKHCLYPNKSRHASKITFHKLHFILSAWLPLLFPQKKLHSTAKKRASPACST
jgi:hypothetical protein